MSVRWCRWPTANSATEPEGELPISTISDLAAILTTSGTTGPSKGCMISNGYFTGMFRSFDDAGLLVGGDRIFTAAPFFHVIGQVWCVMTALVARGSAIIEAEFSASRFMARGKLRQRCLSAWVRWVWSRPRV
jgi:acyl-CoA synthetase (AMP-forming)/AMP-acid ligase II